MKCEPDLLPRFKVHPVDVSAADGSVAETSTPPVAPEASAPTCKIAETWCGKCTDLRVDPDNCGECGRSCLGKACVNTACEVELWVPDVLGAGAWVAGSDILYRREGGELVHPLFARDRFAGQERALGQTGYWTAMTPLGATTQLVVEHMATGPRLRRLDVATGGGDVVYAQPTFLPAFRNAAVDGDDVYFTTREDVRHVKLNGTGYEVVHQVTTGLSGATMGLAVSPTTVYFGVVDAGDLWALPRAPGATARRIDVGTGDAEYVTIEAGRLFWVSGPDLRELTLDGEGPAVVHPLRLASPHTAAKRDGMLWIADVEFPKVGKPDPRRSQIVRFDFASKRVLTVASGLPTFGQIAVDDRYVYIPTTAGGIYRVAR